MRNLLKKKEVRQILILAVIAFLIYYFYHLLLYILFYYRVHYAKLYTSDKYITEPVAEEDSKTITWMVHKYVPDHNAGSEWMAHAINMYLIGNQSYYVNVLVNSSSVHEFERVHIIKDNNTKLVESAITHSSVLLTHHTMMTSAVYTGMKAKRPVVILMHDPDQKAYLQEFVRISSKNIYLINNSYWLKEYYSQFNIPSIVIYPPVYWKEYNVETSCEFVTLINLNENKGGHILYKIAKAMPDVKFLGVAGSYNNQIIIKGLPNLTYMENTPYIQSIYAKTDILLVPSKQESWGRVAIEAMSSGIPVIAHPTPGLLESCDSAGIFCDRNNISAWVKEIRHLKEDAAWRKQVSEKCLARAQNLDPNDQLDKMATWLSNIKWRD
jgi:glycosyltransferase involved in cell wall biosynthesis